MSVDPTVPAPHSSTLRVFDPCDIGLIREAFERHGHIPPDIDARWHLTRLAAEAGLLVVEPGLGFPALIPVTASPGEARVVVGALKALLVDAAGDLGVLPSAEMFERLGRLIERLDDDQ
ncbi:MAG: hypothetical protein M3O32_00675 [Actinomycetota bacterium]|nr:hypothetical protein [Actinomycetota bacterium]